MQNKRNSIEFKRDRYYSITEVAQMVGVDRHSVWTWIRTGAITYDVIGAYYVIKGADLEHALKRWLAGEIKLQHPYGRTIKMPSETLRKVTPVLETK